MNLFQKSGVGNTAGGAAWADGTGKPMNLGGHLTPADRHGSVQVFNFSNQFFFNFLYDLWY